MARLLAYTPTYANGPRPETLASVAAQVFDGELVHVVDPHNPYPNRDMRNVLIKFQQARQMALDEGYDALLTVEHDHDLPPDTVQKLWNTDAPVVYAPYLLRHGSNVLSLWQWTGGRNLGMSLSLYQQELARYRRRGVGPVCGVGFGCTLMRREVLERIEFRGPDSVAPDLPFALDCIKAGIKPLGRFDIEVGHYEGGVWLWPWKEGEKQMAGRIYMLQTINANVGNGESMALERGHYYTLPAPVREDLIRAGYATPSPEIEDDMRGRETADAPPVQETAVARVVTRRPKKTVAADRPQAKRKAAK